SRGWVLVPEDSLAELRSLESALRDERANLAGRCSLEVARKGLGARQPQEMVRLAVHERLKRMEGAGCNGNGPARARAAAAAAAVANGNGKALLDELRRRPLEGRAQRFDALRRQAERRAEAAERRAMAGEERRSTHVAAFRDAWERRVDYDVYCALATLFGPLPEVDFAATGRPGRALFEAVERPVQILQRFWRRRLPRRRRWKSEAAAKVQCLWRGHRVRRRWWPILKLRLRCGRRRALADSFRPWRRRWKTARWVRERLGRSAQRWRSDCFAAWKGTMAMTRAEHDAKLHRAAQLFSLRVEAAVFRSWRHLWWRSRRVRTLAVRVIRSPAFSQWVAFTAEAKRAKRALRAVTWSQSHYRGRRQRQRYCRQLVVVRGLRRLLQGRLARRRLQVALASQKAAAVDALLRERAGAKAEALANAEAKRLAALEEAAAAAGAQAAENVRRLLTDTTVLLPPAARAELIREAEEVKREREEDAAAAAAAVTAMVAQEEAAATAAAEKEAAAEA
ncbi:unnamed protein product, partial [Phaeothamnion confervicola]